MSDTKIKEGIFIGPQIRELMQDKQFDEDQNETERNACLSFKRICKDFLRNHKAANYLDVVQDLLTLYTSYGMQYESENSLSGVTLGFLPRKSWRSQWQQGESDTKASGPHLCWQNIAGH